MLKATDTMRLMAGDHSPRTAKPRTAPPTDRSASPTARAASALLDHAPTNADTHRQGPVTRHGILAAARHELRLSTVVTWLVSNLFNALFCGFIAWLLLGCASVSTTPSAATSHTPHALQKPPVSANGLTLFSGQAPGATLPIAWRPWVVNKTKKPTTYQLVPSENGTVLHATSQQTASGLMHSVDIDIEKSPLVSWKWKINNLLHTADNTERHSEDSPVRVLLAFEGDKSKFSFKDTMAAEMVQLLTGQTMPYATLMYIWENKQPVDSLIDNSYTGRVKMIVAESGDAHVGQWRHYTRNIAQDFFKAFGEAPGRLIGVGILSDTDNTQLSVESWYGDIQIVDNAISLGDVPY